MLPKLDNPFKTDFIYAYSFLLGDFISTHIAITLNNISWSNEANPFIRLLAVNLGPLATILWPILMFFTEYTLFKLLNIVDKQFISLAFSAIISASHFLAILLWTSTIYQPLLQLLQNLMQINALYLGIIMLSISILILSIIREVTCK